MEWDGDNNQKKQIGNLSKLEPASDPKVELAEVGFHFSAAIACLSLPPYTPSKYGTSTKRVGASLMAAFNLSGTVLTNS